jgi:hypothetical protein
MTIKELIEQLQTLDPDLYVFVSGYEGGYNDAGPISNVVDMALDYHEEWYYGKHEKVENCHPLIENKIVKGILL